MALQLREIDRGTVLDGQYLLERQLGAGGMGTIWLAQDLRLGRSVAVKFLSGDFHHSEHARQRFEREARMVGKVRSPHVVQVFATGVTPEGVPYVVMELLDGEDLASRLERNGPCTLPEAGAIIEQVCRALARSHREGLVHRDIKPHNIFLTPEAGGQIFVKLLDFGIAKDVALKATALTVTGAVVGSVYYMSPEQLRDAQSVDHLADLWALGVVTYQMLTGTVPFDGDSLPELLVRITSCSYVPASEVNRSLPKDVDAFLSRAITPDRSQRYADADELARAFSRIVRAHASGFVSKLDGLPLVEAVQAQAAAPPRAAGSGSRLRAWLLVVALCVVGGYYFWQRSYAITAEPQLRPAPASAVVTSENSALAAPAPAATAAAAETSLNPQPPIAMPPASVTITHESPKRAVAERLVAPQPVAPAVTPVPEAEAVREPARLKNAHQYGF